MLKLLPGGLLGLSAHNAMGVAIASARTRKKPNERLLVASFTERRALLKIRVILPPYLGEWFTFLWPKVFLYGRRVDPVTLRDDPWEKLEEVPIFSCL